MWFDELPTNRELHDMVSFLTEEQRDYILGFLMARVDPYESWSAFHSMLDWTWIQNTWRTM